MRHLHFFLCLCNLINDREHITPGITLHTHARTRTEDKVQHSRLSPGELSSWSLRESRPCFIRHWSSSCFAFPVASLTSIRSVETELRNQLPRTTSVLPGALGVLQYFSLALNTVYKDVPNEILSVTSTITATLMKAKHLAWQQSLLTMTPDTRHFCRQVPGPKMSQGFGCMCSDIKLFN